MKISQVNPFVWAMLIILYISRYCAVLNPALSGQFKIGYEIAVFVMMYAFLAFEQYRLDSSETDWKELCEKGELKK